jgi:hypothetical protein
MISSSAKLPSALQSTTAWSARDDAAFRWLTRRFETVVRDRSKVGDQLKAIFEGRDPTWGPAYATDEPAQRLLADIRHGRRDTPAPIADTYRQLCETERGIRAEVTDRLMRHPVGPWLGRQHGVGTMLAAQLLSRLDRSRAPRPSSFWAFCGLATMPAESFVCPDCGARVDVAVGTRPPRDHADARDTANRCGGVLARDEAGDAADRVRVATSRGGASVQKKYDQAARVTCHLIGVTMVRTNGTYASVYNEARDRFARDRKGWSSGRIHLSALRVMEKRFLLDLWHAWPHAQDGGVPARGVQDGAEPTAVRRAAARTGAPVPAEA